MLPIFLLMYLALLVGLVSVVLLGFRKGHWWLGVLTVLTAIVAMAQPLRSTTNLVLMLAALGLGIVTVVIPRRRRPDDPELVSDGYPSCLTVIVVLGLIVAAWFRFSIS